MLNLLLDLLNIQSYSGDEEKVAEYIISFCKEYGVECTQDAIGNVYGVRGVGNYILLNAHMDSVQGYSTKIKTSYSIKKKKACRWCDNFESCYGYKPHMLYTDMKSMADEMESYKCDLFAKDKYFTYEEDEEEVMVNDGVVAKYNEATGYINGNGTRPIGGDDKCGIAMALHFIREVPDVPIKLFFSVEEEIGCNGVRYATQNNVEWFQDIVWGLTIDRRGYTDICYQSCSVQNFKNLEYLAEIAKVWIKNGFVVTLANGSVADVLRLREVIPDMVNISAGYEEPHSNSEKIHFPRFMRIYNSVKELITSSDINWMVTSSVERVKMLPKPEVKVQVFKDEKEENATKNVEVGLRILQKKDVENFCMGSKCPKYFMVYELLAMEAIKQKRPIKDIVEFYDVYFFLSTYLNGWVDLPGNWRSELNTYMDKWFRFTNLKVPKIK